VRVFTKDWKVFRGQCQRYGETPTATERSSFVELRMSSCVCRAAYVELRTFLWAGLALMFGWRSRYRAHGSLALVIVVLMFLQFVQVGLQSWV
jgi:hypothetical protein